MDPPKREGILNYLSGLFKVLVTTDSKPKKMQPTPASTSTLLSSPRRKTSLRPSTSAAAVLPQYDNSGTSNQKPLDNICNLCTERHSKPLSQDSSSSSIPSFIEITIKDSEIEMDSNLLSCSTTKELGLTNRESSNYNDDQSEKDNCQRSSRPRTRVLSKLPVRSPSDHEFGNSPSSPRHHTDAAKGSRGDHWHLSPKRSLKKTHHCPAAYGERREVDHKEMSCKPRKTSIPRPIVRDRQETYDNPIPSTSTGKTEVIYIRRRQRTPVNDSLTFLEHTSVDKSAPHKFTSTGTQVSKVYIQEKSTTTSKTEWKQPIFPRLPQIPVRRTRAWETPESRPRVWEEPRPIAVQEFARRPTVKQEDEKPPIVQMEGEEILKLPLNFDEPCPPRRIQLEEPANAPLMVVPRGEDTLKLPLDFDRPCTPKREQPSNPPSRKSSDLKKKHSSTVSVGSPTPEKKPSTPSEVSTPPENVEKKSSIIKVYTRDDLVLRFHSNFTAVDTYPVIRPCPFRVLRTSPTFGLDDDIENQPTPPGTSRGSVYSSPSAIVFSKLKKAVEGIQPELSTQKPKPQQPEQRPQSRESHRSGPEDTPQVYPSTSRAAMPVVYPSISRNELELPSTSRSSVHSVIQSSSKASDHSVILSSSKASTHSIIQGSSKDSVLALVPEVAEPIPSTSMDQFLKPSTSRTPTASTSRVSTPRTRPNTPKAYSMSELPSASKPSSGLRHCFPTKATCMEIPTYSDTTESEMLSISRRNSKKSVAATDSSKSNFRLRRTNTGLSVDQSASSNLTTIDEEKISIYSAMSTSKPNLSPLDAVLARYDELDSAATLAKAMRKRQLLNNEFPLDDTELQLLEECGTVEEAREENPRSVEAPNWQSNDFYEDTDTEATTDEDSQKKKAGVKKMGH